MHNEEEETRITQNQQAIRDYLLDQFKGFELTKDKPEGSLYHWFTVTNIKAYTQYTLKVSGARLSDRGQHSEHIKHQLDLDNVAGNMRDTEKGGHFSWGW